MKVQDLIDHLTTYAKKSPENPAATVMLQFFDEQCYGIIGANDAKGMYNQHFLIIVPDLRDKIGVKAINIQ